ncbi:winged helix-turn-helix domain-containing protein [Pseudovibrio sp. Ad37]|uniref:winged helix-turn-helix domain-containing protein n=1 Tax=Pseudovibrio sp. Ad37 TaxID=989422 RepID=UPI0007AEC3DF|nr:winged helix-turn-helix domain-containing protein [Pseudovibrio sp. Ad37]KZL20572.1 Transposase [Pseudovibrio sp. Ad37]
MGKPYPIELRERVVAFVEAGNTHRASALQFQVSIKFVNDMVRLKRESGSLQAKRQGNPGHGKLSKLHEWVRLRLQEKSDLTLDELARELSAQHGLKVHRSSVGRLLHRLGLSHKKRRL